VERTGIKNNSIYGNSIEAFKRRIGTKYLRKKINEVYETTVLSFIFFFLSRKKHKKAS